jgi:hypothetical protein
VVIGVDPHAVEVASGEDVGLVAEVRDPVAVDGGGSVEPLDDPVGCELDGDGLLFGGTAEEELRDDEQHQDEWWREASHADSR